MFCRVWVTLRNDTLSEYRQPGVADGAARSAEAKEVGLVEYLLTARKGLLLKGGCTRKG
jgi:hypothetical protein